MMEDTNSCKTHESMMNNPEYQELKELEVRSRAKFLEEFSIEQLKDLSGIELLRKMFYSDIKDYGSLSYHLEHNRDIRKLFGSIMGGSAYKFGLFYHTKRNCWTGGSSHNPNYYTEEDAIQEGERIRDMLVIGSNVIESYFPLESVEDYAALYNDLLEIELFDQLKIWVMKYYHMIYPEWFAPCYTEESIHKYLRQLGDVPDDNRFVAWGQLSLALRREGINDPVMVYLDMIQQGSSEDDTNTLGDNNNTLRYWLFNTRDSWNQFHDEGILGVDFEPLGDLSQYGSKEEMKDRFRELVDPSRTYRNTAHASWQFANEIKVNDVVFVKKGKNLIGRGVITSDYKYDESRQSFKNFRNVDWTHDVVYPCPEGFTSKVLTDITPYVDSVQKINALYDVGEDDDRDDAIVDLPVYTKDDFLNDVFIDEVEYNRLVNLIRNKKNIILQGAPGVGKTYAAKRLAYSIMGVKDADRVSMVQFHQSYSYEDFIMGFRPSESGFELKKGAFYNFCKKAEIDDENEYFFIIDEINRGNMSRIFGELFMLIENDKRGQSLQLLYSNEMFSVPRNVHIIGMMNTADRSLALLDYALRRRFSFYELNPGFDSRGFMRLKESISDERFDRLISCVKDLNKTISMDDSLGSGFCIGHSYFCIKEYDSKKDFILSNIVEYDLIPMLKEYWFDEPQKVRNWSDSLRNSIR